ncbi:MAG: SMC-Scp complex subunit ScpB [Tistlia sp.]|uniref:SMC-Scp complex subunit ScpB n=1 Tax=Tistlia sp. TaxID=3057121 RepID=UPI0034A3F52F
MSEDRFQRLRLLEALLFAASEPQAPAVLARHFPEDTALDSLLEELQERYANRGVHLVRLGERWAFRTAPDLAGAFELERTTTRKLTRAAIETLAIVAYHQPVTRGEIEELRGVALSKGTLDTLLEAGWIRPRGRRRSPGKPVTWGTSDAFLEHFGLESLDSLPGIEELKAAGLLDSRPAVTILGERGLLPPPSGLKREEGEDEEDEDEEDEDPLGADFGEDLLPEEAAELPGEVPPGEEER